MKRYTNKFTKRQ